MNLSPDSFALQHSDVPQPKLLDGPVVNDDPWPMPGTHPMPEEPFILGIDLGRADHSALAYLKRLDAVATITTGEKP